MSAASEHIRKEHPELYAAFQEVPAKIALLPPTTPTSTKMASRQFWDATDWEKIKRVASYLHTCKSRKGTKIASAVDIKIHAKELFDLINLMIKSLSALEEYYKNISLITNE